MGKLSLIASSALYPLKAGSADKKTVKLELAVVGKWEGHSNGRFEITAEDLQTIKANFDASEIDVVVDYEHMTLWGASAPAAGWIKTVEIEGESIFGEIQWLDAAKEAIEKGEYRYISPVLDPHTVDQVSGDDIGWSLHSAALTNKPFLEELGEVKAAKNNPTRKEEEGSMTEEEKVRLDTAEAENKTLKEANAALLANSATTTVNGAIAAKKISKEQEGWALTYCKSDPEGFADFLKDAKAPVQVPGSDQFQNSDTRGQTTAIKMTKV